MPATRKRILIVENDADMLFILGSVLTDAGYAVQSFNCGSCIVESDYTLPDLFILDKDMPTIDGLAISKYLRVHETTKHIPIIMISAYEFQDKAKRIGVDEFIRKPFELSYLLESVNKYTHVIHDHQSIS